MPSFEPKLTSRQEVVLLINQRLKELFEDRIDQAAVISPGYQELWQTISQLANSGGKRLRPYMVQLAYGAYGGSNKQLSFKAALAVELLHQALLIHDDVIDRDTMRYGQKNISGQYQDKYAKTDLSPADIRHYADSMAILAGDLLISEAHRLIASLNQPAVQTVFSEAVFSVCGGELLDTEAAFRDPPASALIVAKHKAASYSLTMPLVIGALLADASQTQLSIIRQFAESLGVAYQLHDDLLGMFGDEDTLGKSTTSDIREGKQTYLIEQFYKLASTQQITDFNQVFGQADKSSRDYALAASLLATSGAASACQAKITELETSARQQIARLSVDEAAKQAFSELVSLCLKRNH